MSFRNRPGLDRRHRPRWQDELRSQQLIVAGFAVAIAIAIGIFGATAWSNFYDSHLREVANVGGTGFDRDQLAKRTGIILAELQAKGADLTASDGGAHGSVIQQQLQVIQDTLQNVDSNALDSLTTGAFMRADAGKFGIAVGDDAVAKEVTRRQTLPFQVELSLITVNALPKDAASGAKPTDAQWAAAEQAAKALLAQVKGGADFAKLAKDKSADEATASLSGLAGWIQEGDAVYGTFFDDAKASKAGDLLGPIKGDIGYAIVKVDAVRQATTDTRLKDYLSAVHASDADYREYVRDELLKTAYQAYFGDTVLTKYMPQRHVAQIVIQPDGGAPVPKQRVRHVLIQPIPGASDQSTATPAQWAAALAEANQVYAELSKPNADWTTVAKQHGDDGTRDYGGDLGWYDPTTAASSLDPDFAKAMQALKFQEVSKPVKTQFGYHVIQVFERRTTAMEQATNVLAEVQKAPDTFAAVARRESSDHTSSATGGDIGWVAPYEKDADFEQAVFALTKKGQISDKPVTLSGGIYIFKLLDTSPARYLEDDRRSSIRTTGYPTWRDQVKSQVGVWVDPSLQTATSSTG